MRKVILGYKQHETIGNEQECSFWGFMDSEKVGLGTLSGL